MFITPQAEDFIRQHIASHTDTTQLLLSATRYPDWDMPFLVQQIEGRRKAVDKLPTYAQTQGIIYPPKLAMEQCSSEQTAAAKSNLLLPKNTLLDLTGGFGIDAYAFSKRFEQVVYIEQNPTTAQTAIHNFGVLRATNIKAIIADSLAWLQNYHGKPFDVIYLDPARRNQHQQKTVALADCEPNIMGLLPFLFRYAPSVMLKTSPMLDIDEAIRQLGHVTEVAVISVENECKEVVFILENTQKDNPIKLHAIAYRKNQCYHTVSAKFDEQQALRQIAVSQPLRYLYEPDVAYLKANMYAGRYYQSYCLLHPNTHLLTSQDLHTDFIGRVFEIRKILTFNELKREKIKNAHLAVRNFPMSVAQIRAKTKIAEGGDLYLFAVTLADGRRAFLYTRKVA